MSYQDKKSENFSYFCREGKIKFVQKWIDNPNVDVNWNYHSPLRNAVKYKQKEVIELLLTHPKLKTDYENQTRELSGEWKRIKMIFNPFTEAMKQAFEGDYEMLDLLVTNGKFKIERVEHLNILVEMENKELTDYFLKIPGFPDFIISRDSSYAKLLIPQEIQDLFLF